MKLFTGVLLVSLISFESCNQGYSANNGNKVKIAIHAEMNPPKSNLVVVKKDSLKKIQFKYGFFIKVDSAYDLGEFKTYSYIELWHNNIKLLTDTSREYEFNEKQYPIVNRLSNKVFELLIEYNNRPNKDLLILFRIKNEKIIKTDTLPTFDGKPEVVNGFFVNSGSWGNSEEWDENDIRYTSFDPEIYYKFTPNGIKLDSALTRSENKETYGNIDPFEKGYEIGFPIDDKGNIDTTYKNVLRKKIEPSPKNYFKDSH